MKLSDNRIMQEDVERASAADFIDWEKLRGKTVLVTGATGLIGGQVVMTLLNANAERGLGLKVIAAVRSREKAEKLFCYADKDALELLVQDVQAPYSYEGSIDYIIHGASITSSKAFVDTPVETIFTAINGTRNLLDLAREKQVEGMVYLSSLEVYGVVDFSLASVDEKTFGSIDPMSVRSSYSEGKRIVETLCTSYAHEYGVPVKVARLCQSMGAGVGYNDGRVFAQFARAIIEGKDIVLMTDGSTERNYCYISDAVTGILTVLLKGETAEAYNVANKDTLISIRGMAEMLIENYPESGTKLVFNIAEDVTKLGYNPKVKMNLATDKAEALGWRAETGLKEMFDRLIESMKIDR
ncbi:NAD(P)-dependent oxidoreductase [uncultured Ruminococcus sp.]|uniref:NAD-dependent epimerase/dehydratase family protein n=1 Tax=uncultured Ruminococcus sp. TaxID=165186 RepID=UPI0025DC15C6|nr:NAD-dependent epimerase/dehydratase family protein [uncultured Ruminococcus sp.]